MGTRCCKLSVPLSDFISGCPALERERVRLISSAPTSVQTLLPDHVTSGKEFSDVILGINWVSDHETQIFYIDFLSSCEANLP